MNNEGLFRVAFHYRPILLSALRTLPYKSSVRRAIETEFLGILNRNRTSMNAILCGNDSGTYYATTPKFTVETFGQILSKYLVRNASSEDACSDCGIAINCLVSWWRNSLGSFSDDQVGTVSEIVRLLPSAALFHEYLIMLLNTIPETDTFDPVRAVLQRQFLDLPLKQDPVDILRLLTDVENVAAWDVTGKTFKTVWLPDDIRQKVLAADNTVTASYLRNRLFSALMFALRTEEEFLDYWKKASDAWRRDLTAAHGKISKPLLSTLIRKYHRNEPILTGLLKHPLVDNDILMFYAVRGNETAKRLLNRRVNPGDGGQTE